MSAAATERKAETRYRCSPWRPAIAPYQWNSSCCHVFLKRKHPLDHFSHFFFFCKRASHLQQRTTKYRSVSTCDSPIIIKHVYQRCKKKPPQKKPPLKSYIMHSVDGRAPTFCHPLSFGTIAAAVVALKTAECRRASSL